MNPKTLLNRLIQSGTCCEACGKLYGKQRTLPSTWHTGKCGVCRRKAIVTETRDFDYLHKGQVLLAKQIKAEERRKKKIKRMNSITFLKKEADRLFSLYIRQRGADIVGNVQCCTCGITKHWTDKMQNGHWIHRDVLATRYEEANCHAQCVGCNMFGGGKEHLHELYIIEKHGAKERDRLLELSKVKHSDFDYRSIINKYS